MIFKVFDGTRKKKKRERHTIKDGDYSNEKVNVIYFVDRETDGGVELWWYAYTHRVSIQTVKPM